MLKVFHVKFHDGRNVINEDIETNVGQRTTEVKTDGGGNRHTIFNDYNKVSILNYDNCHP